MSSFLLSRPTLSGTMKVSPNYRVMGIGLTDTILLIGHADAQVMYNPYQVNNIQDAINFLNADSSSPLVRALLEVYNNGCKDIWLYPVAPMSEYEPNISQRFIAKYDEHFVGGEPLGIIDGGFPTSTFDVTIDGNLDGNDIDGGPANDPIDFAFYNFYENYYNRLNNAYNTLIHYDQFAIVLPLEAVHYDAGGVDFTSQLIHYCDYVFTNTGACSIGILGTRIIDNGSVAVGELVNDSRLNSIQAAGKFVMIVMGEGLVTNPQIASSYNTPLATQVASLLASAPMDRSIAGMILPHVASLSGPDLTEIQKEALSQARINPVVRSIKGKRGLAYQTKLMTDNTLALNNSDFWTMGQMHILSNCLNQIRYLGYTYIGTLSPDLFKEAVYNFMQGLMTNGYIRDYTVDIAMSGRGASSRADVNISLFPIFGIRNIFFNIVTGPGS